MSLASSLASANAWVDARVAAHGDSAAAAALVLALAYALTYLFAARLPGARAEGYVLEFDVTPRYSRPRLYRLNGLRVLLAAALVFAAAARLSASRPPDPVVTRGQHRQREGEEGERDSYY